MIELLVAVMIIAILLAILLPVAHTALQKMRIHQVQADIVSVEAALEGYKSQYGKYPSPNPTDRIPVTDLSPFMKFPTKRVLSSVFYDPWYIPYRYAMPGGQQPGFADIASAGPDRQINDTNWKTSSAGVNADNIDNWSQKR